MMNRAVGITENGTSKMPMCLGSSVSKNAALALALASASGRLLAERKAWRKSLTCSPNPSMMAA
jgi:hypothetical protein